MNRSNLWILDEISTYIQELKESKQYFRSLKDFTRDRVFTFDTVFFLIADLPRKSLGVEVEKGMEQINKLLNKRTEGSKSGFCKARMKIKSDLFKEVSKKLTALYYGSNQPKNQKRWKGFLLMAIDGSIADVIDMPLIRKEFGVQRHKYGFSVQSRMMIGYDVLNKIIRHSCLGNLSIGEGNVVKDWMDQMSSEELCIYDRLYPGCSLQYLHHHHGVPYVMRCKTGHNERVKAFVKSKKKEKTEQWSLTEGAITELRKRGIEVNNKTTMPVRMVRVKLDDGEVEILISSLVDNKKYPHKVFKALYFKRWGVETTIGYLKNILQIELSSGRSVESVYQDFYATIFRANVQSLLEQDCEVHVNKISARRKYDYQINRSVAAGNLKGNLAILFLAHKPIEMYNKLMKIFIKNIEPIRPGRTFPRKKKCHKRNGKYKPMLNYKKAV